MPKPRPAPSSRLTCSKVRFVEVEVAFPRQLRPRVVVQFCEGLSLLLEDQSAIPLAAEFITTCRKHLTVLRQPRSRDEQSPKRHPLSQLPHLGPRSRGLPRRSHQAPSAQGHPRPSCGVPPAPPASPPHAAPKQMQRKSPERPRTDRSIGTHPSGSIWDAYRTESTVLFPTQRGFSKEL
jgi:hypothetical protein